MMIQLYNIANTQKNKIEERTVQLEHVKKENRFVERQDSIVVLPVSNCFVLD